MPAVPDLRLNKPENVILALIRNCPIERHHDNDLDMHFYQKDNGYTEMVDIVSIQCLVGHIWDHGWWTIIDHSGKLAHAEAVEE